MALAHANEVSASVGVVGAAPLFVVVLIALGEMPIRLRAWRTSPVYLLTYGVLLAATHTLTFSVSNNAAWFGARILALGILSTLAQIAAGGRDSLVPASLLTVLAVAVPITILPTELRHLPSPTLSFLPIPGLAGAGVLCTLAAGLAPSRASRAVTTERRPTGALTRTPTIRP